MSLVLKNGVLVLPDGPRRTDLLIQGEKIAAVGDDLCGRDVLDCSGKLVFPGFVDPHTHFEMNKGLPNETADSFSSGTRAALAGGTTCVIDFATQNRGGTLTQALATWHSRADGNCSCHYGFHMAITDWNEAVAAELPAMTAAGVTSYKVYLAYDALRLPDGAVFQILCAAKTQGALVSAHCENGDLVNQGVARQKALGRLSPAAHPDSRPDCVEAEAVSRFLAMGELADTPVYVVHLSTVRGLDLIRAARARGQTIFVETCPQYFLLNYGKYLLPVAESMKFVCSPPLRAEASRTALTAALLAGDVDVVATDHCSFSTQTKALGVDDFSQIPNGLPGVEHRPVLLYNTLQKTGHFDPILMKNLLSTRICSLFGLHEKGELLPEMDADLVVWDPSWSGKIFASQQVQAVDYTPYEGMEVEGRADAVFLSGQLAARQGKVLRPNRGKYLHRKALQP